MIKTSCEYHREYDYHCVKCHVAVHKYIEQKHLAGMIEKAETWYSMVLTDKRTKKLLLLE